MLNFSSTLDCVLTIVPLDIWNDSLVVHAQLSSWVHRLASLLYHVCTIYHIQINSSKSIDDVYADISSAIDKLQRRKSLSLEQRQP